jgi:hypothetical protein
MIFTGGEEDADRLPPDSGRSSRMMVLSSTAVKHPSV